MDKNCCFIERQTDKYRCFITLPSSWAAIVAMGHKPPFKASEVMEAYARTQATLDPHTSQDKLLSMLNDAFYARRKPESQSHWCLVRRNAPANKSAATEPFSMPSELVFEIVDHVEDGLLDTLRTLRLVSRQFKAAADKRLFGTIHVVGTIGIYLFSNSLLTGLQSREDIRACLQSVVRTDSLMNCQVISVKLSSHRHFFTNSHIMPTHDELRSFAKQCEEAPLVVGKIPSGHIFVGWGSDEADARAANCIERIFEDGLPVWQRQRPTFEFNTAVDLTLICYSEMLPECIIDSLKSTVEAMKDGLWRLCFGHFHVQVYRRMKQFGSREAYDAAVAQEVVGWNKLAEELKQDFIVLNVRHMSPYVI